MQSKLFSVGEWDTCGNIRQRDARKGRVTNQIDSGWWGLTAGRAGGALRSELNLVWETVAFCFCGRWGPGRSVGDGVGMGGR